VYKEIIKEMLQCGALRGKRNHLGLKPIDLLNKFESKIKLQTEQDYIDEFGEDFDEELEPENQYKKFEFYLGLYKRESAMCCPKHAPLEKVERN